VKIRKQSGCVVYRKNVDKIEILLVQKVEGESWGFPKGGIQKNMTEIDSAAKETFEEAGVQGKIGKLLGEYMYRKNGKEQIVSLYPMKVEKELDNWPEMKIRQRKWVSVDEAKSLTNKKLHRFYDDLGVEEKGFMQRLIDKIF
jgi:8-oxo-dGTP pyrophosphatase MutT (NUDIX family)